LYCCNSSEKFKHALIRPHPGFYHFFKAAWHRIALTYT
jgi:hypothetical protein